MGALLLLFVVVPMVELALLLRVGAQIGSLSTIALIVVTGTIGAALARRQGINTLSRVQAEAAAGRMPASAMLDGVIILIAGALLITPGILTDVFGFACLVPGFRSLLKAVALRRLQSGMHSGQVGFGFPPDQPPPPQSPFRPTPPGAPGDGPVIDVTPNDGDDQPAK